MEKQRSLGTRALFAVILFFGFYLLALAIAAGLLFIPYLEWKTMHRVSWRFGFSCLAGAGIILWSIAPRRDKFEPPGPRLNPDEHPRFFKTIETIARDLGQAMPRDVYLIPVSNAWVASRGGIMGIGSRRVMSVGIPLLQTLTVSQFTAVLAHELGHYCGGDVKLGPWIYKTRLAVNRTILGLQKHRSILQILFIWYGNFFLKLTSSISRGQELAADRLAASIAGAPQVASALRKIDQISMAFGVYWQEDVSPVLEKGFCPPVVTGFSQFLSSDRAEALTKSLQELPSEAPKPNPYDSHPTLDERLAALKPSSEQGEEMDSDVDAASPLVRSLLNGTESEIEQGLMAWVQATHKPPLIPVSWQDVGEKVWRGIWKEGAARFAVELVRPAALADFPRLIKKEALISPGQAAPQSELTPREVSRLLRVSHKYGSALANAMIRAGWNTEVFPGAEVILEKGGVRFMPFLYVIKLARGEMDEETWRELCREAGISDLSFRP